MRTKTHLQPFLAGERKEMEKYTFWGSRARSALHDKEYDCLFTMNVHTPDYKIVSDGWIDKRSK